MKWYSSYLISGKPIKWNNTLIYQPKISDIFDIGEETFNSLLNPFLIDYDILQIPQELRDKVSLLDCILISKDLFNLLITSLKFFFRTEDIIISSKDNSLIINKQSSINNKKFQELSLIILDICQAKKSKETVIVRNKKEKKIQNKLEKHRKQAKKQKGSDLLNIYNTVVHGQTPFDYDGVANYTMWQLINSYNVLFAQENNKKNFDVYLTGYADSRKLDLDHWSTKIQI